MPAAGRHEGGSSNDKPWSEACDSAPHRGPFLGEPPWNKIGDSVRWLVHDMKMLGMDFGTGTRAIAVEIRRVGTQISRSTVQGVEPSSEVGLRLCTDSAASESSSIAVSGASLACTGCWAGSLPPYVASTSARELAL